jgi:hypothetical protein
MASRVTFNRHADFQRSALHMAAFGALAGLLAFIVGKVWPGLGGLTGPAGMALVMAAAAHGAADPSRRDAPRHLLYLAVMAGVMTLGAIVFRGEAAIAALVAPAAFMLARGPGGLRLAFGLAVAAIAVLAARLVILRLVGSQELAGLPAWLTAALAGSAGAFVAVVGTVGRHLTLVQDRVAEARAALGTARLAGEMGELVSRADTVWARVSSALPEDDQVRHAVADAIVRLYEVARRWHEVEHDGGRPSAAALVDRMAQLDARREASTDEVARAQYGQARAALAEQLRYVEGIATSRERVLARMHNYLAVMERLRLAMVSQRSADASHQASEVKPILDDLRDLGSEIELSSAAVGEMDADAERDGAPADTGRPTAQA